MVFLYGLLTRWPGYVLHPNRTAYHWGLLSPYRSLARISPIAQFHPFRPDQEDLMTLLWGKMSYCSHTSLPNSSSSHQGWIPHLWPTLTAEARSRNVLLPWESLFIGVLLPQGLTGVLLWQQICQTRCQACPPHRWLEAGPLPLPFYGVCLLRHSTLLAGSSARVLHTPLFG